MCDLYRARWDIEVFFKQVKQTLKLGDFLGHSANAIRWSRKRGRPRCCSLCCCATRRTLGTGGTVLRASSRWCERRCGSGSIWWNCCEVMGQQAAVLPFLEPHMPRGCLDLRRNVLHLMGQHPPKIAGKSSKTPTRPPSSSPLLLQLLQGLPPHLPLPMGCL